MEKSLEFLEYQSNAKLWLEDLLLECNKHLPDEEGLTEEHETDFGTLRFSMSGETELTVYCYLLNDAEFTINGIAYRNLRGEVKQRWTNCKQAIFTFTKVDSWDGKRFNDSPTDSARLKVSNTLQQLCLEVYNRMLANFPKYVTRQEVLKTKSNISKVINDLNQL